MRRSLARKISPVFPCSILQQRSLKKRISFFHCRISSCLVRTFTRDGELQPAPATAGNLRLPLRRKLSDLQLHALNFHRGWRCDDALFNGSIGDRFSHPRPADMASSIDSPGCAATFVNRHSPVVAVSGIANTYVTAAVISTPHSIPIANRRIIFLFPTVSLSSLHNSATAPQIRGIRVIRGCLLLLIFVSIRVD